MGRRCRVNGLNMTLSAMLSQALRHFLAFCMKQNSFMSKHTRM